MEDALKKVTNLHYVSHFSSFLMKFWWYLFWLRMLSNTLIIHMQLFKHSIFLKILSVICGRLTYPLYYSTFNGWAATSALAFFFNISKWSYFLFCLTIVTLSFCHLVDERIKWIDTAVCLEQQFSLLVEKGG